MMDIPRRIPPVAGPYDYDCCTLPLPPPRFLSQLAVLGLIPRPRPRPRLPLPSLTKEDSPSSDMADCSLMRLGPVSPGRLRVPTALPLPTPVPVPISAVFPGSPPPSSFPYDNPALIAPPSAILDPRDPSREGFPPPGTSGRRGGNGRESSGARPRSGPPPPPRPRPRLRFFLPLAPGPVTGPPWCPEAEVVEISGPAC